MRRGEPVTAGERNHHAPPVRSEPRFGKADLAASQVRDDSLPYAGRRIVQPGEPERFDNLVQHGGAGDNDLRPPGTDPGNSAAPLQTRRADLAIQAPNLSGGGREPVRQITPGTPHS